MATSVKDKTLYCARCGITFLYAKEEQNQAIKMADDNGITTPTHCLGCRILLPNIARQRGIVKWFNGRKRFGFIMPYDGKEIFMHGSEVRKKSRIKAGDLVEFSLKKSNRGPAATDIQLLPIRSSTSE